MKKTVLFIFALAPLVYTSSVLGQIKSDSPAVLSGIDSLYVALEHHGSEPNGLDFKQIESQAKMDLNNAGLTIAGSTSAGTSEFVISAEFLNDHNDVVCRIQSSLLRPADIIGLPGCPVSARVWHTPAIMQSSTAKEVNDIIRQAVSKQVKAFISQYKSDRLRTINTPAAAQLPSAEKADSTESAPAIKTSASLKPQSESSYVASKNSKVFHKKGCSQASRITSANAVTFTSRADAANSGRRPCKVCNP